MLRITRRVGESIKIDEDTYITVIGLEQGLVEIGIYCPKTKSVKRSGRCILCASQTFDKTRGFFFCKSQKCEQKLEAINQSKDENKEQQ